MSGNGCRSGNPGARRHRSASRHMERHHAATYYATLPTSLGEASLSDQTDVAWYIERDGQRFGPFSAGDFERFEAEKQLVATDYVWRTGLDGWVTYAELQSRFAAAAHLHVQRAVRRVWSSGS